MFKKGSLLTVALMSFSFVSYAQGDNSMPPEALTLEQRVKALENDVKNIKKRGKFEDIALDKANASSSEVLSWSQDKLLEIYSYNFMNYHDVIKYIKNFFTQPGYDSYLKALDESKNRDVLESQKLIVYAVPAGGAVVEHEGIVDGIYEWNIKVPLLVSYRNDHGTIQRKLDVNLIVVRVPNTESERGYAIHAIRAKEVTEANPTATSAPASVPTTNLTTPKIEAPKTSEEVKSADKPKASK